MLGPARGHRYEEKAMIPIPRTLANGNYVVLPGDILTKDDEELVYLGVADNDTRTVVCLPVVEDAGLDFGRLRLLTTDDLRTYYWANKGCSRIDLDDILN